MSRLTLVLLSLACCVLACASLYFNRQVQVLKVQEAIQQEQFKRLWDATDDAQREFPGIWVRLDRIEDKIDQLLNRPLCK